MKLLLAIVSVTATESKWIEGQGDVSMDKVLAAQSCESESESPGAGVQECVQEPPVPTDCGLYLFP